MTLRKSIALLFALALVAAACGDDDTPAPPATVIVEVPGETVTVTVNVPGETITVTETRIVEVEVTAAPVEMMEVVDMSVFATPFTDSAQVWMGLDQGFYEDAGLDVAVRSFASGSQALTAFRSGAGDVLQLGELPAMAYWTQSEGAITVLGGVSNTSSGYVIVADADILTAQDLAGKKVGLVLGSTNEFFLDQYLKANGMTLDDVDTLNVGNFALASAIDNGDIDALVTFEPFGFFATRAAGDKVHQLADGTGVFTGHFVYAVRTSFLEEYPDAVARFVEATHKGQEVVLTDADTASAYMESEFGTSRDDFDFTLSYTVFEDTFTDEMLADFDVIHEWLLANGIIESPVDFGAFLWSGNADATGG